MKIICNCFYIHQILQKCGSLLLSLVKTRRLGESEVLTVTSSSTLSQVKVQGEADAKGPDEQESERRAGHPIKKKKKSMHGWWWVSFSISLRDSYSRWPLGRLAVRPSVSSLPIRHSTVKRSRGGICRFVTLQHQGGSKYLYHCQCV